MTIKKLSHEEYKELTERVNCLECSDGLKLFCMRLSHTLRRIMLESDTHEDQVSKLHKFIDSVEYVLKEYPDMKLK